MNRETKVIGILDSGVGGLTVVREVMRQLPYERIVYFGDTAHCPYGSRTPEEVRQFTLDIVDFLTTSFSLKALVMACNTATAVALEDVRQKVDVPVIGVIHPGARSAVQASTNGRIGVIGTERTVQSGAYRRALTRLKADLHIVSLACPSFVPLVESGRAEADDVFPIVQQALTPLFNDDIDTLILGCTHYPLLRKHIARAMGDGVTLISSATETARELKSIMLQQNTLTLDPSERPEHRYFTSGSPRLFRQIAASCLQLTLDAKRVHLEKV